MHVEQDNTLNRRSKPFRLVTIRLMKCLKGSAWYPIWHDRGMGIHDDNRSCCSKADYSCMFYSALALMHFMLDDFVIKKVCVSRFIKRNNYHCGVFPVPYIWTNRNNKIFICARGRYGLLTAFIYINPWFTEPVMQWHREALLRLRTMLTYHASLTFLFLELLGRIVMKY